MVIRSTVLDRKYICEYDVGLWALGTVQVLRERRTNTLYTCKVVPKARVKGQDVPGQLLRLRDLQHRLLCSVIDVLEDHTHYFIVSSRCSGSDLAEWMGHLLEDDSYVQEQTVAEYIRQALIALAHSHSSRVYHRDLRPSNLVLSSEATDAVIKLCDCGLMAVLDPDSELARQNPSAYTAPELLTEQGRAIGGAPDVWSIGAIAHLLLVGHAPRQSGGAWNFLSGRQGNDGWSERSALSRDFVQQLLQQAGDRPTAACALQHPWLKSVVGLEATNWIPGDEVSRDIQRRLLCYMLAVLLIPDLTPQRHFHQLRSAFVKMDTDRDGFLCRSWVQKLLVDQGATSEAVAAAVDVIDIRGTDVLDLCATVCVDLIVREFFAAGQHGRLPAATRSTGVQSFPAVDPQESVLRVKELAPRMLRRFFQTYGEDPKQLSATIAGLESRLATDTRNDLESFAGVRYDDILASLPEDCSLDSQFLVTELTDNAGRGTPLYAETKAESAARGTPLHVGLAGLLGIDSLSEALALVFHTCGSTDEKQRRHDKLLAASGCAL